MKDDFWSKRTIALKREYLLARLHSAEEAAHILMEKLEQIKKMERNSQGALALAREFLDLYAPLADQFGMGNLKTQMENFAFSVLKPLEYQKVKEEMKKLAPHGEYFLKKIKSMLEEELGKNSIEAEIKGRTKGVYSTYQKLKRLNGDLGQIYDLVALRVICLTIEDCYRVLSIISDLFEPLSGQFNDYIQNPKVNGYRSIHTTVKTKTGVVLEFQIRTAEMDREAEWGKAAHWYYSLQSEEKERKEKGGIVAPSNKKDKIFVQTPQGDLMELPQKSTVLDFAFGIHSDLGDRTLGAKVNAKMVTLDYELNGGEVVLILTSKKGHPSPDWLSKVKTEKAKQSIRHYLAQHEKLALNR